MTFDLTTKQIELQLLNGFQGRNHFPADTYNVHAIKHLDFMQHIWDHW